MRESGREKEREIFIWIAGETEREREKESGRKRKTQMGKERLPDGPLIIAARGRGRGIAEVGGLRHRLRSLHLLLQLFLVLVINLDETGLPSNNKKSSFRSPKYI